MLLGMNIWHRTPNIDQINQFSANCMVEYIGIVVTEVGGDYICAKMPVDHRTTQPYGLLHGGASVVLAETLGSMASQMVVDSQRKMVVGLAINANHVRSVREGFVYATARAVHLGKMTHIWEIDIVNEKQQIVCVSRLTMAILDKE